MLAIYLRLLESPGLVSLESLDVQGDVVACGNLLEVIYGDARIDSLGVGQRVAVLPMMQADVSGASANAVNAIAPVLCTALRERRKLHIDKAT